MSHAEASPVRVLELRSVWGTGGGPEKTILAGAAQADPARVRVTVAYLRDARDDVFGIDARAAHLGVDYVEIRERHSLDRAIWRPLCDLVRRTGADVVHAHDYKTNLLALLLARRLGVAPLTTAHGWTGHSTRERHVYYPADRWLARWFPRVVAVSGEIRNTLVRAGCDPERVVTVLNGIDPRQFRRVPARRDALRDSLGLSPSDVVLGSVGRLEPQKRFDLLLDAVARLERTGLAAHVVIVGEGGERTRLQAEAARLGLAGRCHLLGHRDDVADLHNVFDLYVQSSDYEGTPNTVLEAMALETPVVATDAGGTRELARDDEHGVIVPVGRADLLADAIAGTLADRTGMLTRVRAARARVETDLSFAARQARLEEIYATLVAGRRRRPRLVSHLAA